MFLKLVNLSATTANVGTLNVISISNLNSLALTNHLYAANAVTTTNIFAAGFTSNASNTVFNYSTLTVPFINSTTLNVASTSNITTANILVANVSTGIYSPSVYGGTFAGTTVSGTTITASTGFTGAAYTGGTFQGSTITASTGFTGAAYTGGTFYGGVHSGTTITASTGFTGAAYTGGTFQGSTMSGTTITASTGFTGAAFNGGSLNITGISSLGQFSPGLLAGNIRNILWGTASTASVTPGPVNDTVTIGSTLAGTNYLVFMQSRYSASQTLFTSTINVKTTTTFSFYAYRITGVGSTVNWDWMVLDYN